MIGMMKLYYSFTIILHGHILVYPISTPGSNPHYQHDWNCTNNPSLFSNAGSILVRMLCTSTNLLRLALGIF